MNRHAHIYTTAYCFSHFQERPLLDEEQKNKSMNTDDNSAKPQTQFLAFVRLVHLVKF